MYIQYKLHFLSKFGLRVFQQEHERFLFVLNFRIAFRLRLAVIVYLQN